jgi:hypothetical protein
MSQGEVNALALSVFLPRATMPESPFRFLVIDDPVQAMDPAKVDGLAQVLNHVAAARQVIVFTHDDRLPEAIRRLGIDATVLEVTRQLESHVAVRRSMDPAERALEDAGAVGADNKLSTEVMARVVGPLCRTAVEAVLTDIARRKLLQAGRRHHEVGKALSDARKLRQKAALAMFADVDRAGDVMGTLNRHGAHFADTFRLIDTAAHLPHRGDVWALIGSAKSLVEELRKQYG